MLVYKRVGGEILPSDLPRRVLRRGVERAASGGLDPGATVRAMMRQLGVSGRN